VKGNQQEDVGSYCMTVRKRGYRKLEGEVVDRTIGELALEKKVTRSKADYRISDNELGWWFSSSQHVESMGAKERNKLKISAL
jgi:hypothetical protein